MANYDCGSCEDLRTSAPHFVANGFTSYECNSLKNNTGLNPSSGHDDCTDLNDMADCLVGNMEQELPAYDTCDWKPFMKRFIPNVWSTLKGIICAICGIWTMLSKLSCYIDYLFQGADFEFSEYETTSASYIVAGKGVSFLNVSDSGTASDILLRYVAGGLSTLDGSLLFYTSSFTDGATVYNFDDNGTGSHHTKSRSGNSYWNGNNPKPIAGGELAYEIRLKRSDYPQIKTMFNGFGLEGAGGAYHDLVRVFRAGEYAWGQHGYCNTETGNPAADGADRGHLVPSGWLYIQMRISYMDKFDGEANGHQYTPRGFVPIRMNQDAIDC